MHSFMRTKQFGHIILVLLLLISTAGVSINKHYSGGELFSTAFFVEADTCCETPCGCCDESTEFIQVQSDYLASTFDLTEAAQLDLLFSSVPLLLQAESNGSSVLLFNTEDTSPPPLPDLCILNQVFRL
eukprot:TRINITY_DN4944_c0_g1_i1.p3 TRINITY_DN4944_c0_g1~~TRINITY_DN4944_c0_g1_i1.p3  ORF type:complete len:129 (-),score=14.32 TRINITY_DN4944_c0_g1_i1:261-647(-)